MRNLYYNPDGYSDYNFDNGNYYSGNYYIRNECKSLYDVLTYRNTSEYMENKVENFKIRNYHRDGVFKRIIDEFSKNVYMDIEDIINRNDSIENKNILLNNYLAEKTSYSNLEISFIPKEELDKKNDSFYEFLKETYSKKFKKWEGDILKINIKSNKDSKLKEFYYPIGYTYDRLSLVPHWYKWNERSIYVDTRDIVALIAVNILAKISFNYYNRDECTREEVYNEFKLSMNIKDENEFIKVLNEESFISDIEMNEYYINPNMTLFFVIAMSKLINEELDIQDLEKRLEQSKSNYATSYITKKNIPKSIQEFMDNNEFLNVFSYVEADELCDLNKLEKIEEEFIELTNLIPIAKMETYSLRFRRLGRQKALGIYYPMYRTMCVDIRSVSSFIHEFFHMIDYKLGILSFDSKFKPLRDKSVKLIQENMNRSDIGEGELKTWYSKNKYGNKYYLSNDEVFARLGEIYIREVLGIKTSFNKREFETNIDRVIYEYDDELFSMIKIYFDELFCFIKEEYEIIKLSK